MLVKLLMSLAIDGTITKIIIETMVAIGDTCRGIYVNITQVLLIVDLKSLKRKNFWKRTLFNMETYGINIEDNVQSSHFVLLV